MLGDTRPRRALARAVIGAAAAVALSAGGLALTAVPSSADTTAANAHQPIPTRSVNLHTAYARALPHASHGPIKYQPTHRHAAPHGTAQAAAATCTEPNCPLPYNGGQVQGTPAVYLLLWGPNWNTAAADAQYLAGFYDGLCGSGDNWTRTTFQYGNSATTPSCSGGPALAGGLFYHDSSSPPTDVTPADIGAEADAFLQAEGIAPGVNEQVVVAAQSGTCYSDGFGGNCGTPQNSGYCGWHTWSSYGETFTNLPYSLDAGGGCGEDFVNSPPAGTYDGFSIIGGHEFAESITDPVPNSGWEDPNDLSDGGGEIGDKCAWGGQFGGQGPGGGPAPIGDVTLSTGSYAMQSLWSNSAGGCVLSTTPPPPDSVTITSPTGPQTSTVGTPVSLQIQASSSDGYPITSYGATGLPPGLSVNTSSGLISGTPTTAGTYSTQLQANDKDVGTSEPIPWTVTPAKDTVTLTNPGNQAGTVGTSASLQLQGTSSGGNTLSYNASGLPPGLSVNNNTGLISGRPTTAGTYQVTAQAGDTTGASSAPATFTWTVSAAYPAGIITGYFGCLDDYGSSAANGTKVDLYTCNGTGAQKWTLHATQNPSTGNYTGELVSSNGACVNDAGYGGTGSKVILWTCTGTSNEVWTYWPKYKEYSVTYGGHTYCMNDPGYSTTKGTQQIVWTCPDTSNEQYTLPGA